MGICTGPSCKNELEWSPDSSNIPSHLRHGYLTHYKYVNDCSEKGSNDIGLIKPLYQREA